MFELRIDEKRCKACGLCQNACPRGVIEVNMARVELNGLGCAEMKNGGCVGCGICALVCPDIAIEIIRTEG